MKGGILLLRIECGEDLTNLQLYVGSFHLIVFARTHVVITILNRLVAESVGMEYSNRFLKPARRRIACSNSNSRDNMACQYTSACCCAAQVELFRYRFQSE